MMHASDHRELMELVSVADNCLKFVYPCEFYAMQVELGRRAEKSANL